MTSCTFHPFSRSGWRARGLILVGMQRIELCPGPKRSNAGGAGLVREIRPLGLTLTHVSGRSPGVRPGDIQLDRLTAFAR